MFRTAAATICLLLIFLEGSASAARPVPSVLGTSWQGAELFKGSLKGAGRVSYVGNNALTVDEAGGFIYTDADGVQTAGSVVQYGRKLTATLAPASLDTLEEQLAGIIEAELSSAGLDPGEVTVSIDPASVKLKVNLKTIRRQNAILFSLKARFIASSSVLGVRPGKFQTKGLLVALD